MENKYYGHNYVCLDLETSGFEPSQGNFITEIALILICGKKLDIIGEAESFVSPYGGEVIDQKALDATGISRAQINGGESYKEIVKDMIDVAKELKIGKYNKPILVAHNAKFERKFLEHLFLMANRNIWDYFEHDMYDTMKMSRDKFGSEKSHTLSSLCERFDIVNDSAHRAMADTKVTAQVFIAMQSQFRGSKTKIINNSKSVRFRDTFKFQF